MMIEDVRNLQKILRQYIKLNAKILDVGCGIGSNIALLKELGYKHTIGVDISTDMVTASQDAGHEAYLFEMVPYEDFDVLLFSHVIEHLGYPDIVSFLETYFSKAKQSAQVIVITPVLYDAFYNDVDHIKPYYPNGLMTLFSDQLVSRQYKSRFSLTLKDIYFRRTLLLPYNRRMWHLKTFSSKFLRRISTHTMKLLKFISFGTISKTTGYTAIFDLSLRKTE